jgi:hypothetical protein
MDRPQPDQGVGAAVRRFAEAAFTLDVRGLAAFRISLGVILIVDCLLRSRDFSTMFGPDGIFPPDEMRRFHGDPLRWSLALAFDSPWWAALVLAAEGIAGACMAAGWYSRAATIAAWVAVVSVTRRTAPATNAGDVWLCCLLFWSMFLPLAEVWAMDARRRRDRRATACSVATAAFVLQSAFVYFGAGLAKCNESWLSGEAMSHALSVHDHGNRLGSLIGRLRWLTRPLTWCVVAAELAGPVLLVAAPVARVRAMVVAAFIVFHVVIWMTMSVGLFAWIGITAWLPLVPSRWWDAVSSRPEGGVAGLGRVPTVVCTTALAVATISFLHYWGVFGTARLPRPIAAGVAIGCLDQEWSMFGSVPPQEQWVYGRAELADGRVVDLLRGGRPLERERPDGGFISLAHHRWHKLFWMLPRPHIRVFAPATAARLAREWNDTHPPEQRVVSLEIRFAAQSVSRPDAALQEMLVAAWPPRGQEGEGNLDRLLESVDVRSAGR